MSIHSTLLYKQRDKIQILILRKIATDGKHSKKSLENMLEKHHPVIDNAVNQLLKKSLITKTDGDQNNKRGQPEKFYRLTEEGIVILIDEIKISLNEFWRMLFKIFDTTGDFVTYGYINSKNKFVEENHFVLKNLKIGEIIKKYENSVLGYKRERVIPKIFPKISNIQLIINCELTSSEKLIMESFALYGSLSLAELSKKTSEQITSIPHKLFDLYFIVEVSNEKYKITLLGMQYFMFIVFKQLKHNTQMQKMVILLENQKNILPLIFKKWKWLTRYFSNRELFDVLIDTIDPNQRQLPFQTNYGVQEILDSHRNLEALCKSKIKHEHEVGSKINFDVKIEKIINIQPFRTKQTKTITNFFEYLGIVNDEKSEKYVRKIEKTFQLVTTELDKLKMLSDMDFIDKAFPKEIKQQQRMEYEHNKTDSLSFRFYSILLSHIYQKNETPEQWFDFLKTDKDIMPWYRNWIKEIDEFENKNVDYRNNLTHILS